MTHRIDKIKQKTGLSEYKIAQLSGINKQTLNNEKRRKGGMSEKTARKVAKGLGISLSKFYEEYGD